MSQLISFSFSYKVCMKQPSSISCYRLTPSYLMEISQSFLNLMTICQYYLILKFMNYESLPAFSIYWQALESQVLESSQNRLIFCISALSPLIYDSSIRFLSLSSQIYCLFKVLEFQKSCSCLVKDSVLRVCYLSCWESCLTS